jgi:hypothetical protein
VMSPMAALIEEQYSDVLTVNLARIKAMRGAKL